MQENCLIVNDKIRELAHKLPGETDLTVKGLVGLWQEQNHKGMDEYLTAKELSIFKTALRNNEVSNRVASENNNAPIVIPYFYQGKQHDYTITGTHIYNSKGEEVFKTDSVDRNRIFANLAVRQKRAVIVNYRNNDYVVNLRNQIISVRTGEIMQWGEENDDRKAILSLADNKFKEKATKRRISEKNSNKQSSIENELQTESPKENSDSKTTSPTENYPIRDRARIYLDFTPLERKDRATLIARLFSEEVTRLISELISRIDEQMQQADYRRKLELLHNKYSMSRVFAIKTITPLGIFKRVRKVFSDYVNDTEEGRINAELNVINSRLFNDALRKYKSQYSPTAEEEKTLREKSGAIISGTQLEGFEDFYTIFDRYFNKYTQEQKRAAAEKIASHKFEAYNKILSNYNALCTEASVLLKTSEGIVIDSYSSFVNESEYTEEDWESEDSLNTDTDSDPSSVKEGWMIHFREVSSFSRLSQKVRKTISQIPKLGVNGKYEKDDLGFQRYLDANYVHAILMDACSTMIDSDDLIPVLRNLEQNKTWVGQIIKSLQEDPALFSQFYQDFMKGFAKYWIQKSKLAKDGSYTTQTIPINEVEGIEHSLTSWRSNFETGTLLDADSIYNTDRTINRGNAEKGLAWTETLQSKFDNLNRQQRIDLIQDNRIFSTIVKLLRMIGIDTSEASIMDSLMNIKEGKFTYTDPIELLLPQLHIIYRDIAKGKTLKDDNSNDVINSYKKVYSSIARLFSEVQEDTLESTVYQNGKSYYGHVNISYLDSLIRNLKAVHGDEERFKKWIEDNFGRYDWFKNKGKWLCDWIEQLANSKEDREALDHKILLDADRVGYADWDSPEYLRILLTEYWSVPASSKGHHHYAWYHIPVLADAQSAEFIKFRRYMDAVDEDGNPISYKDILLDKFSKLVVQEYNRIKLVEERNARRIKGDNTISPIANYDITYNDKGDLINKGGSEFKFLPRLNDLTVNGVPFIDALTEAVKNKSGYEVKALIKEALKTVLDEGFMDFYADCEDKGLFETTEQNTLKYKYLPFQNNIEAKSRTAKALEQAKNLLGDEWLPTFEEVLNFFKSEKSDIGYSVDTIRELLSDIQDMVAAYTDKITADNINRFLEYKNSARDALEEYYWNSTFAQSQIIEITVTDLAFFRNLQDFYKRIKQIHTPILKYNTKATFHGQRIGRDVERTIYLKDSIVESEILPDIKEILDTKVAKGELEAKEAALIYKEFKKVNVTDAQAYRCLDSYRAILGMQGQWTDEDEEAMYRLEKGIWDIRDFNRVWQTKKPFTSGSLAVESGIEGNSPIKVPVQHKNSEFLLLAMYSLLKGPQSSPKLRAINRFMKDRNIDVVQFESCVKVGNQEPIDLEDCTGEEDTYRRLMEKTGAASGKENPNVVHSIDYNYCGIVTSTPEHDDSMLKGTQIMKLIVSDLLGREYKIGNKAFSSKDIITLFNRINAVNVLESFLDTEDLFKDRQKLSEILLNELKGSARYSTDLAEAVTLDKNGEFFIPIFDPVISSTVQSMFGSIVKKRIAKQKIKGKPLLQATCYGSEDLHIIFEGSGENKRVKYYECYVPCKYKNVFGPLMNRKTHTLDIDKLPEDLRKCVIYRIPTEGAFSMVPAYIKGFLPQQNGDAVMLPKEITAITGDDNDGDKMYVMLPEFDVRKSADGSYEFDIDEYDYDEDPFNQTLEARNNAIIDIIFNILTNSDSAFRLLSPGNPRHVKRTSWILDIIRNSSSSVNVEELSNLSDDELSERSRKFANSLDPLSTSTQIYYHYQNMMGANLIGVYATHDVNHALVQQTSLSLNDKYGAITLNGKRLHSLHDIVNDKKQLISKNTSEFLDACVDNAKEAVLASLNQDLMTSHIAMLLSRLGHEPLEIGLFLNQPIVNEVLQSIRTEGRQGISTEEIIKKTLIKHDFNFNEINEGDDPLSLQNMTDAIISYNTGMTDRDWHEFQYKVGLAFQKAYTSSKALKMLVTAMRADTDGGAAGTISVTKTRIQAVLDYLEQVRTNRQFPLENAEIIRDDIDYTASPREILDKIMDSPVPYIQSFITLGLMATDEMYGKWFPQYTESFDSILNILREMTRSQKLDPQTIDMIYNDLFTYIMSKIEFFGKDSSYTAREKREEFIRNFPLKFKQIISRNKEISKLSFIDNLHVIQANYKIPVPILSLSAGKLTPSLKETFTHDWESLLYSDKMEVRKLALDLFLYGYYRRGFGFGPSTFNHLAPIVLRKVIPQYETALKDLVNTQDSYNEFIDQFIYNHLDSRRFVPSIGDKSTVVFTDENGNPLNTIIFRLDETVNDEDKKIILKKGVVPEEDVHFRFIGKNINNKMVYYRMIDESDNTVIYEKFEGLGMSKQFLEYEYGVDAMEMQSVFEDHGNNNVESEDSKDPMDSDRKETPKEDTEDVQNAIKEVYGSDLVEQAYKNAMAIEANTEFKDSDGKPLCGVTVKVY